MSHKSVSVFWDYGESYRTVDLEEQHLSLAQTPENCAPSCDVVGKATENIRRIALEHGEVKLFNAYAEVSDKIIPYAARCALQTYGVSLIDCPHRGQKDVVDKRMIGMPPVYGLYATDTRDSRHATVRLGDSRAPYDHSNHRRPRLYLCCRSPHSSHARGGHHSTQCSPWGSCYEDPRLERGGAGQAYVSPSASGKLELRWADEDATSS